MTNGRTEKPRSVFDHDKWGPKINYSLLTSKEVNSAEISLIRNKKKQALKSDNKQKNQSKFDLENITQYNLPNKAKRNRRNKSNTDK